MSLTVSHRIGDIDVTILTDGATTFDADLFSPAEPGHIAALLKSAGESAIRTNFNASVIRTGGKVVLVDTGPRDLFGPECGNLPAALAEAGVDPAEVQTLFLTHLHPDHAAGAVDKDGRAIFANAELVLMEDDRTYWADDARFSGADDTTKSWQELAKAVLAAYGDRLRPVSGAAQIAPGMTALPLPGHTPGHAGYRLVSGDAQMVHVGDIVHAQALQLADPEISVAFDLDGDMARAARKRLLDEVATDGILCTGGHFIQPKLARIERDGAGYRAVDPTR
jgi:glyoxylase-like metal-dependent hydrolase (beta-lactamase superfamily II)